MIGKIIMLCAKKTFSLALGLSFIVASMIPQTVWAGCSRKGIENTYEISQEHAANFQRASATLFGVDIPLTDSDALTGVSVKHGQTEGVKITVDCDYNGFGSMGYFRYEPGGHAGVDININKRETGRDDVDDNDRIFPYYAILPGEIIDIQKTPDSEKSANKSGEIRIYNKEFDITLIYMHTLEWAENYKVGDVVKLDDQIGWQAGMSGSNWKSMPIHVHLEIHNGRSLVKTDWGRHSANYGAKDACLKQPNPQSKYGVIDDCVLLDPVRVLGEIYTDKYVEKNTFCVFGVASTGNGDVAKIAHKCDATKPAGKLSYWTNIEDERPIHSYDQISHEGNNFFSVKFVKIVDGESVGHEFYWPFYDVPMNHAYIESTAKAYKAGIINGEVYVRKRIEFKKAMLDEKIQRLDLTKFIIKAVETAYPKYTGTFKPSPGYSCEQNAKIHKNTCADLVVNRAASLNWLLFLNENKIINGDATKPNWPLEYMEREQFMVALSRFYNHLQEEKDINREVEPSGISSILLKNGMGHYVDWPEVSSDFKKHLINLTNQNVHLGLPIESIDGESRLPRRRIDPHGYITRGEALYLIMQLFGGEEK